MPYFRPLWKLTFASAILFASLVSLGMWQLDRLQWKLALIAQVNRQIHAPPLRIDQKVFVLEGPPVSYVRVIARGTFDYTKEAYLFASDLSGNAGYHVIVPFKLVNGDVYLVDRGYVPKDKLDPSRRYEGQIVGEQTVIGLTHDSESPGIFTPSPDIAHRIWYSRDARSIARADHIWLHYDGFVDADATPNPGGWPRGGQTVVKFRNEHLQYAITWFGLAAVLFGVYIAYHISRGRLGFKR